MSMPATTGGRSEMRLSSTWRTSRVTDFVSLIISYLADTEENVVHNCCFKETRILPLPSIPWWLYIQIGSVLFLTYYIIPYAATFPLSAISTVNSSKLIHYQAYNCTSEKNYEIDAMFNVLLSFASYIFWNIQQPHCSVNHIIRLSQKLRTTSIYDEHVRDNMLPSTLWEIIIHFYKTVFFFPIQLSTLGRSPRQIHRAIVLVQTRSVPYKYVLLTMYLI